MNKIEDELKPKFYTPVVASIEGRINAITASVDTVRVGMEIGKVDTAYYAKTLKVAIKELFTMLNQDGISELERNVIKTFLTQYHALLQERKRKSNFYLKFFATVIAIGSGVLLGV